MVEFIYKRLGRDTLNTGYKPRNIKKKSHMLFTTRVMLDIPSQYVHYCLVLLCKIYCVIV